VSEVAVVRDAAQIAKAAAELCIEACAGAVAARGKAHVALTGGSTAPPLYQELRRSPLPWSRLQIWFTDERAVPPSDPLSNYGLAQRELLSQVAIVPAQVHRLRGEAPDLDAEAARAADELRTIGRPPRLDLVLLGLGPDGHILSLFAGVASSAERGDDELVRHVAAPEHVEPHVERLTLTPFLVVTARMVVLQVSGEKKREVLARALKAPEDLKGCPAQWLRHAVGRVVIVADAAAAAGL
jgi:6-phosphogluconolactonase